MANTISPLHEAPSLAELRATQDAISHLIHRTPVLSSAFFNELSGAKLFFKCENFQKIGAFKMRGAASAALRLSAAEKQKGLATHSSGNHAQAVARVARELGVPSFIVMPENAPASKRAATLGYGAEIITCAATVESRETTLAEVVQRTGATFIHPFNDYNVIAGQATAAIELIEYLDLPLDMMLAPIGGGGLMSGTALATRYLSPNTQVFGTEPLAVDDAQRSLRSGHIETNLTTNTIADGLRTNLGEKTFGILSRTLDEVFTVTEDAIIQAMQLVWERMKIIIEPSSAVPLAAVLSNPAVFKGKRVGIIITGGNVDLAKLPWA